MDDFAWRYLGRALALVLVLEGLGPFVLPGRWRETMSRVAGFDDKVLRTLGLLSMISGLVWLRFL